VVYYPSVAQTLVNAYYSPALAGGTEQAVSDPSPAQLESLLGPRLADKSTVWLAYQDHSGIERIREWLTQRGYRAVATRTYWYPLGLQLFAKETTVTGGSLLVNGDFKTLSGGEPVGWQFGGAHAVEDGALAQINVTENPNNDARQVIAVKPNTFYFLSVEHRSALTNGSQKLFVVSLDAEGKWLDIAPNGAGQDLPPGESWARARLGFLTPPGAVKAMVLLRTAGTGNAWFRNVALVPQ
jgi:hypothetical protein